MKEVFKRLLIVIHFVIFLTGLLFTILSFFNQDNSGWEEIMISGIGLLILGPILKYIFFGKFLIFPWSK